MDLANWSEIRNKYAIKQLKVEVEESTWGNKNNKLRTTTYDFKIGDSSHFELRRKVFFKEYGEVNTYEHYLELEIGGKELKAFLKEDPKLVDALIYLVIDTLKTYQHELRAGWSFLRITIRNNDDPPVSITEIHSWVLQFLKVTKDFRTKLNLGFEGEFLTYHTDAKEQEKLDIDINYLSVTFQHLYPDKLTYASRYMNDGSVLELKGMEDSSGNVAIVDYYEDDKSTFFPGNPEITHVYGFHTLLEIMPLGEEA